MKLPCQRRQRRVRQRRRLHQGTDEGLQFGVGALGVWCFALSTVLGSSVWHRPDEPRGPSSPPQASWPLRIRPVSVECALALRGSWPSPANVMPPNREYEPGTTPKWHKLLPVKANTVSTCFVGIHAESSPFQRSQRYAQNYRNNQTIFLVGVTCDSEVILAPGTQKTICDTVQVARVVLTAPPGVLKTRTAGHIAPWGCLGGCPSRRSLISGSRATYLPTGFIEIDVIAARDTNRTSTFHSCDFSTTDHVS